MSRIAGVFKTAARNARAVFIPYITAGDPGLERTVELGLALERAGAGILELGVPFSDPIADGPTNQRAAERALAIGVSLEDVLRVVREIRERSQLAMVLFTYANPVVRYGVDRFAEHAASAGVDGVLFTDVPAEEMGHFRGALKRARLDPIMLVTPTSTPGRMKAAARLGRGFLYLVSRTGVTGARSDVDRELESNIAAVRHASRLPVAVGFGISTAAQVSSIAAVADGVVVGSAIVNQIADEGDSGALVGRIEGFAASLAAACQRAS